MLSGSGMFFLFAAPLLRLPKSDKGEQDRPIAGYFVIS